MRSLLFALLVPVAVAAQRPVAPPAPATVPSAPKAPVGTQVAPPAAASFGGLGTTVIYDDVARAYNVQHDALFLNSDLLRHTEFARLDELHALNDYAFALNDRAYALSTSNGLAYAPFDRITSIDGSWLYGNGMPPIPQAWAQADPADSMYRSARELLNRGDYRRAAAAFAEIPRKHPSSAYNKDAPYWQAFALYRIGGTPELQEALTVLEARKAKYPPQTRNPNTSSTPLVSTANSSPVVYYPQPSSSSTDADALAARIAGVLSSRGLGSNAAVRNALAANPNSCDSEEQSVRAEALSALMQSDPEQGRALATRILARRDDCSVALRRSALFRIATTKDAASTAALIGVAKNDPNLDLRVQAMDLLAQMPGDDAIQTLEELSRTGDDRVQRTAVRILASHSNPSARSRMRALIERNDANEALRLSALDAYDRGERGTVDDATWLRGVYGRINSPRMRERIVSIVGRIGGDANDQWLGALMRNEEESIETRTSAMRRLAPTMDIGSLGKLYDAASQRQIREVAISALANRKEPEAADKLVDIAKNATDPSLRRYAISALARSSDPRKNKMLLDLVDR